MAVTEVKLTVAEQLANMKKGGGSDKEIDRQEEAEAILSFAINTVKNNQFKSFNVNESSALINDCISSLNFLQQNNLCSDIIAKIDKLIKYLKGETQPEGIINERIP